MLSLSLCHLKFYSIYIYCWENTFYPDSFLSSVVVRLFFWLLWLLLIHRNVGSGFVPQRHVLQKETKHFKAFKSIIIFHLWIYRFSIWTLCVCKWMFFMEDWNVLNRSRSAMNGHSVLWYWIYPSIWTMCCIFPFKIMASTHPYLK